MLALSAATSPPATVRKVVTGRQSALYGHPADRSPPSRRRSSIASELAAQRRFQDRFQGGARLRGPLLRSDEQSFRKVDGGFHMRSGILPFIMSPRSPGPLSQSGRRRMTRKLMLNIDSEVIDRAKRHARKQGTSVSQMVETFLEVVTRPPEHVQDPPVLRRLRGSLKGVDETSYRRDLREKYR